MFVGGYHSMQPSVVLQEESNMPFAAIQWLKANHNQTYTNIHYIISETLYIEKKNEHIYIWKGEVSWIVDATVLSWCSQWQVMKSLSIVLKEYKAAVHTPANHESEIKMHVRCQATDI